MTAKHRNVRPDTLPADPNWLIIEASDGSPNNWPKNTESIPDDEQQYNFMKPLGIDDGPSIRWRKDIGQKLAEMLGYSDSKSWVLKDWPSGYRLFDHHKGSINSMRHDLYLFGSSATSKFRSVNEFIPHAYWLIKDGGQNIDACQCKYCTKNPSQRDISFALNLSQRSMGPARAGEVPRLDKLKKHKLRMLREGRVSGITRQKQKFEKLPEGPKFPSSAEREKDIWAFLGPKTYGVYRWAREGELVWVKLNHPINLGQGDDADATIYFWPGLIDEVRLKSQAIPKPPDIREIDQDGPGTFESNSSDEPWTVVQFPLFSIELLVSSKTVVVEQESIIPYQAHAPPIPLMKAVELVLFNVDEYERPAPPIGNATASSSQGSDSSDAEKNGLKDRFEEFDAYPDLPFKGSTIQEMIAYNGTAAGSYALAIETASQLTSFWSPTDVWELKLMPSDDDSDVHFSDGLNASELQAMGRKLLGYHHLAEGSAYQRRFQGLWWGPERIWYGDLVRLKPARQQFIPDGNEVIKSSAHPDERSQSTSEGSHSSASEPLLNSGPSAANELVDVEMGEIDADGPGSRALFMLIGSIFSASLPRDDMRGLEDDCRVVGALYELADDDAVSEDEIPLEPSLQPPPVSTIFAPNADLLSELPSDTHAGELNAATMQRSATNVDTTMPPSVADALATSSEPLIDPAKSVDPLRKVDVQLPSRPSDQLFSLPTAPAGLRFRPLLREGYEVVFPLGMIAGRYYPSFLTSSLLRGRKDWQLKDLKASEHNYLWALDGLVAGLHNAVDPVVFLPRRSEMMRRGEHDAWMQLAEHWRQKWRSEEARKNAIHVD